MDYTIRAARLDDVTTIEDLIARSIRSLGRDDYAPMQIERALKGAFGVDTQLIKDGTYYLVIANDRVIGCGGWSKRRTLFGSDAHTQRDAGELDPARDAAKIRAFFIDPNFARFGLGTGLLNHCENAARNAGFTRFELMATLPGVKLYRVRGYVAGEGIQHQLGDGVSIDFVPMSKTIVNS
jgi:GNAT superfamily N-acetyltransferase